MSNTLDTHVVAYQGDNLYDFDNDMVMTWYPQSCAPRVKRRSPTKWQIVV